MFCCVHNIHSAEDGTNQTYIEKFANNWKGIAFVQYVYADSDIGQQIKYIEPLE